MNTSITSKNGRDHIYQPSVLFNVVNLPTLAIIGGREVLFEWQSTGLFGPGEKHGFYLDAPGENATFTGDDFSLKVHPTEGLAGQKLRFVLADRWLDKGGSEGFSMALRASVDFSAYQLRPLLKFFGDANRRVLIADETGLGKTIEAGMILTEVLAAKGSDSCIVILCPKSVQWKWIKELRTKFGIRAFASNFKQFKEYEAPSGVHVITHSASRTETQIEVPDGSIELLIIDEIHNFIGRQSNQKRRGRALDLSKASNGVLGLSATPIQLEANDLRKLLDLVAPGEHSLEAWDLQSQIQIAVNETMKAQKSGKGAEESHIPLLETVWPSEMLVSSEDLLSPLEPSLWSQIEPDVRALGPIGKRLTRARGRDPDVIGPNGKSLFRKRIVETHVVEQGGYKGLIQSIDSFLRQHLHFSNRRQFFSCPAAGLSILNKVESESESLFQLIDTFQQQMVNTGPKQEYLFKLLDQLKARPEINRTVLFTHWHPTFFHLKEMLRGRFQLFFVHPSADDNEATEVKNAFADCEEYCLLLVTDRMSEGIDLEMANSMVNMDLPYNPAKLQQRIGRLDRYIQESEFIEIHNLALKDSIEEKQIHTLEERLKVFETMIGGFEAVISSDENENDWTEETANAELGKANDLTRLAESSVVLRVIDSSLDGLIGEQQREIHPIHSLLHLIIQHAMQRLGATTEYDEQTGILKLKMTDKLRHRILGSKTFIPWSDGLVRAAFESVTDDGFILIKMKGRGATIGPLDPFLSACEQILWGVEGMSSGAPPHFDPILIGTKEGSPRWKHEGYEVVNTRTILDEICRQELMIEYWHGKDNIDLKGFKGTY